MGGKRPDQYNIAPGETQATDYKSRDDDRHTHQEDKEELTVKNKEADESLIPRRGVNPALAEQREKKAKRERDED